MREKGFSLIETMVAVAIVGIAMSMAIPNYQVWVAKEDLKDGIVDLKGALQIARVTAMATGLPVAVVFNPLGNNARQYGVFIDSGQAGVGGAINIANARNQVWNCEIPISAQGQQVQYVNPCIPTAVELNIGSPQFKSGVTFVGNPIPIEFLSSGKRSVPAGNAPVAITLQNNHALTRTVTVSWIGDVM